VFSAETREEAPLTLLPTGAKTGLSFRFPTAAADAIAQLDPREAVTVEFAFPVAARRSPARPMSRSAISRRAERSCARLGLR
jgi:hypothetical protein